VVKELSKVAARAQNGLAFDPFPSLPKFKVKGRAKDPKAATKEDSKEEDDALTAGCDMRITSKKKMAEALSIFRHSKQNTSRSTRGQQVLEDTLYACG
jgi:hypothetical protein